MACVIFCAGEFDRLLRPLEKDDIVIAADGGLKHTQTLGITPDIILGDFDSLGYVPKGSELHPVEKDDTDAMLAAKRGLALGCREFLFYGSLDGPRLDHTVANFQTLAYLEEHGARGRLIGLRQQVTLLKNGTLTFPKDAKGNISVFAFGGEAEGVSIRGLYYNLEKGTLTPAFPLGVSNHFEGREVTVSVQKGSLLVLWDTVNGFPAR